MLVRQRSRLRLFEPCSRAARNLVSDYCYSFSFFFFQDTATTEIYTLSLHDALPIYSKNAALVTRRHYLSHWNSSVHPRDDSDRKSTRLNSSHQIISYAVFCLKKKKEKFYYRDHLGLVVRGSHVDGDSRHANKARLLA